MTDKATTTTIELRLELSPSHEAVKSHAVFSTDQRIHVAQFGVDAFATVYFLQVTDGESISLPTKEEALALSAKDPAAAFRATAPTVAKVAMTLATLRRFHAAMGEVISKFPPESIGLTEGSGEL